MGLENSIDIWLGKWIRDGTSWDGSFTWIIWVGSGYMDGVLGYSNDLVGAFRSEGY